MECCLFRAELVALVEFVVLGEELEMLDRFPLCLVLGRSGAVEERAVRERHRQRVELPQPLVFDTEAGGRGRGEALIGNRFPTRLAMTVRAQVDTSERVEERPQIAVD